jgi:hypothetical protein
MEQNQASKTNISAALRSLQDVDRRRGLAQDIASGIGVMLQQSYEQHEGVWWLFAAGKPKRALKTDEVEWHVARQHKPFVPDGVSQDDPRWWDELPI